MTVKVLHSESDDIIGQYVTFTKVYHEQVKVYGRTENAIKETIRICKDKNVLREYLISREKEVIDMFITLFDEEQLMRVHDKTVYEQGQSQGLQQGLS